MTKEQQQQTEVPAAVDETADGDFAEQVAAAQERDTSAGDEQTEFETDERSEFVGEEPEVPAAETQAEVGEAGPDESDLADEELDVPEEEVGEAGLDAAADDEADVLDEEADIPEDEVGEAGADEAGDDEADVVDEEADIPEDEVGEAGPDEAVEDFEVTMESVIEAVLFASDESLTPARLAGIVETGVKQVREHIECLNEKYRSQNCAFRIERIAGGYQMLTLSPYNHWLKKLLRARADGKLSPAALETLAIVAYKQPVIRADIEVIRGVAVGEVLRGLMYKGLVKIVGRAEVLGRPMLYGTTKKFLEVFGLNSLKDLPKAEELKKPSA